MTYPPDIDPQGACLCDTWPPAPHCPTHPDRTECTDCGYRHTNHRKEA